MSPFVYAVLCVVAPMAWGLVVVWLSNRIERAVLRRMKTDKKLPPTEYYI